MARIYIGTQKTTIALLSNVYHYRERAAVRRGSCCARSVRVFAFVVVVRTPNLSSPTSSGRCRNRSFLSFFSSKVPKGLMGRNQAQKKTWKLSIHPSVKAKLSRVTTVCVLVSVPCRPDSNMVMNEKLSSLTKTNLPPP